VRKLPMYGTTLFHVHNSKIFAAGHFFIAANSSGVQFLHPITKEELHSAFFFSDLQRWEYTPKVFCFWSTKCDFLEDTAQGRHLVKYSLSTKQGWEISTTLHSYYKVLMQTDVSVHTAEAAPSSPMLPKGKRGHIAYEAESDSGDEGEGIEASKLGGSAAVTLAVTTFTPQPLTPQLAIPQLGGVEGSVPTTHQSALALPLQRSPPAETATAATYVANVVAFGDVAATDEEASTGTGGAGGALFASSIGAASLATMLAAMASGEGIRIEGMRNEFERVKREIEAMEKMKREYEALRQSHQRLQVENEEVRRIVGDMYVSVDEDRAIREQYNVLYAEIMESLASSAPRTGELMPRIYDTMVRMNDEDIRKEYITQMEIILNDDPLVSEKVKGVAEGLSIKLGEMMDQPRHQRIAKLAKEDEERRKGQEQQMMNQKEQEKLAAKRERQKALNRQAFEALMPLLHRVAGVKPSSLQGEQRRLAQRFQNRLELRMILCDLAELKKIGPGMYKSMGTGGLKPEEVRALHYRLSIEMELLNTSADAARLVAMLERKIESLPVQIKEADLAAVSADPAQGVGGPKRRRRPAMSAALWGSGISSARRCSRASASR